MTWDVEGTAEFQDWYVNLSEDQQDRIDAAVELLAQRGPSLGRPYVDTISASRYANLKELRVRQGGNLRMLFMFDPRRTAIMLFGGDKTGQWNAWYERAIPEAERLFEEYLRELREEGLLP